MGNPSKYKKISVTFFTEKKCITSLLRQLQCPTPHVEGDMQHLCMVSEVRTTKWEICDKLCDDACLKSNVMFIRNLLKTQNSTLLSCNDM